MIIQLQLQLSRPTETGTRKTLVCVEEQVSVAHKPKELYALFNRALFAAGVDCDDPFERLEETTREYADAMVLLEKFIPTKKLSGLGCLEDYARVALQEQTQEVIRTEQAKRDAECDLVELREKHEVLRAWAIGANLTFNTLANQFAQHIVETRGFQRNLDGAYTQRRTHALLDEIQLAHVLEMLADFGVNELADHMACEMSEALTLLDHLREEKKRVASEKDLTLPPWHEPTFPQTLSEIPE